MAQEIERRWLLQTLNNFDLPEGTSIQQYYLSQGSPLAVRIREETLSSGKYVYTLTLKKGKGLSRFESNIPITQEIFDNLISEAISEIIKTRYSMIYGPADKNLIFEYDSYHGNFNGLFILEMEFPSESDAEQFELPSFIYDKTRVVEVTGLTSLSNSSLSMANGFAEVLFNITSELKEPR